MENMDSSCHYRRESFGTVPTVSPVLLPATPNPAALSSATFLKGQRQLLHTLGLDTSVLRHLATQAAPTRPRHDPRASQADDFCFVEARDVPCHPVPSDCSAKSRLNKFFGSLRNMHQSSTTWVNPGYLSGGQAVRSALQPQLRRKGSGLLPAHTPSDGDLASFPCPARRKAPEASEHSYYGACSTGGAAWQNGEVLGSQGDQFLFQNMWHDQCWQQQQQCGYYNTNKDGKPMSSCSDSSYFSDVDDSWNVVSARDCVDSNNCSVNGNTGVLNGLAQLSVPSISCVNITVASQLLSTAFSHTMPNSSLPTYSPHPQPFSDKLHTYDTSGAATHEFTYAEPAEVQVNEGYVAARDCPPTDSRLFSVMCEATESPSLALSQKSALPLAHSSLNPNAKEWNGWVASSKLNPEAKEWVPAAVGSVQSVQSACEPPDISQCDRIREQKDKDKIEEKTSDTKVEVKIKNESESEECGNIEISSLPSDVAHHESILKENEENENEKSENIITELQIEDHSESRMNGECSVHEETSAERSDSLTSPPTWDDDVRGSLRVPEQTHVTGADSCSPALVAAEGTSAALSHTSDSTSSSADEEEDSSRISKLDAPELCSPGETAKLFPEADVLESDSSKKANVGKCESNNKGSEEIVEKASPRKSCILLEKIKKFSFSPCRKSKDYPEEAEEDTCEFIIFSEEGDHDSDDESDATVDDDSSDESDDSDSEDEVDLYVDYIDSDESFDECISNSCDDDTVQPNVRSEPEDSDSSSAGRSSLCAFWRSVAQRQPQSPQDISEDDWDWHSESSSGSISASCWAFQQGLMTLKTPINTLSKRLGYVEKERKKSLTEVEKANLKWDTEIDLNVLGNSGQKVRFDEDVTVAFVDKDIERKGEWEQIARDNSRFRSRIGNLSAVLSPVLGSEHRDAVYEARFRHCCQSEENVVER